MSGVGQVIFVHVFLGQVVLAVILAHGLCWWKVYDEQAAFPEDVLQVPMWFPANAPCGALVLSDPAGAKKCYREWHENNTADSDNFTIQMATVAAAALFLCMGWFARFSARRANYEVRGAMGGRGVRASVHARA